MGNTDESGVWADRSVRMPIGRRRVRMAVRMREERTELTCGSVVAVYHNLLVSEMGSRWTVHMTQCGASRWARPKEGTTQSQRDKWISRGRTTCQVL